MYIAGLIVAHLQRYYRLHMGRNAEKISIRCSCVYVYVKTTWVCKRSGVASPRAQEQHAIQADGIRGAPLWWMEWTVDG